MSVLLLSGGLDSAVLAAEAEPGTVALHVSYGQPAGVREREAATEVATWAGMELVHAGVVLPGWVPGPEDPLMLVPGRNLVLLSLAAGLARSRGLAGVVTLGANADDREAYPDCRRRFLHGVERALGVLVNAPLLDTTKAGVGQAARSLGVPDITWSCYFPRDRRACGTCNACQGAARAAA